MSKILSCIKLILIFSFIQLIAGCNEKAVSPGNEEFTRAQLDSMTLASLEKVNNYPFYTMTFYGDYGFADYVKPGMKHSTLLKTTILFEKYASWFFDSAEINLRAEEFRQDLNTEIGNRKSEPRVNPWGCTCFAALGDANSIILGRNFDWYDHIPLLLFTDSPDGYASVSMVDLDYFGFNRNNLPDHVQNNRRLLETPWLPFDGMNEMGVAIGMMAISHAEPPSDPFKKTIGEIEVIRLVLDYAKSTEHAIELIQSYNVRMENPPIHYLIADSSRRSAIVEFVSGKMIVMRNDELWHVSTNFIIHGSGAPNNVSCWRYETAYDMLMDRTGKLAATEAMNLLQNVAQPSTIWSMVYQLNNAKITTVVGMDFSNSIHFELSNN